jgi:23S rRNA (cytosine1962-C5)-methyltransferase
MFSWRMIPCVIFEDEHLLVVNKPAGWNTHAPAPFAGEGIYDWLKKREPRWASLAILHRLDKETSGVLIFGKTSVANKSLTKQFTERKVRKKYFLLTDREIPQKEFIVKTKLIRIGEKYVSRNLNSLTGEIAETKFSSAKIFEFKTQNPIFENIPPSPKLKILCAEPLTGRTHQIRVHAAESRFPVLGDTLYGGTPASRVFLHAAEIEFAHPATGAIKKNFAPPNFENDSRLDLRAAIIDPKETNAFRIIHGASDGWPNWFVDKLGDFLLSQSESALNAKQNQELSRLAKNYFARGVYHKILSRKIFRSTKMETSPHLIFGEAAPEKFEILENGVRFELSFNEGYSVGLFLDQRDNRRRFLTNHVAADFPLNSKLKTQSSKFEVLNTFAYSCGFSVCAAHAGARTTSLDLSKKYLDWGKRNFLLNGLDPKAHDFIFGDTFDWLRRLAKKNRAFDAIILDPPTFSQSKEHGAFRVEKDFGKLVAAALPLLKPVGILFCSTSAAELPPEKFLGEIEKAISRSGRKILQEHYFPQPPDFPVSRAQAPYLKAVWLKIH